MYFSVFSHYTNNQTSDGTNLRKDTQHEIMHFSLKMILNLSFGN